MLLYKISTWSYNILHWRARYDISYEQTQVFSQNQKPKTGAFLFFVFRPLETVLPEIWLDSVVFLYIIDSRQLLYGGQKRDLGSPNNSSRYRLVPPTPSLRPGTMLIFSYRSATGQDGPYIQKSLLTQCYTVPSVKSAYYRCNVKTPIMTLIHFDIPLIIGFWLVSRQHSYNALSYLCHKQKWRTATNT